MISVIALSLKYSKENSGLNFFILNSNLFLEAAVPILQRSTIALAILKSKCKNTKINIYVPANIIEKEIFKYNRSSDYYNDVCFSYTTENETDIAIADRKKEYNENKMSVCEVNCDFTEYNSITKKAKCECNINDEMPTIQEVIENKKDLIFSFLDIKNATNFLIMKCFHKLFTSEGLKKNIGSYIILMIIQGLKVLLIQHLNMFK